VFSQGKSFQQHREAMKKTITDRNQEDKGELDNVSLPEIPVKMYIYS